MNKETRLVVDGDKVTVILGYERLNLRFLGDGFDRSRTPISVWVFAGDTDENLSRKDESELPMPLLRSEDSNESDDRVKSMNSLQMGCFALCVILGVLVFLLGVVLLCATS